MADLIKVSILGTLPGNEVWSVNPVFAVTTGAVISYAECIAIVNAVNALTVPSGVRSIMSTSTYVTGCRVEARTAAGVLEALAEGNISSPVVGQGSMPHPFQTSLVSSLRTTTPGGSGRGRLYWPATGATIDAPTLRMTSSSASTALTGIKSYLNLIQTAVDASVDETVALAVWSRTTGQLPTVNSIQVGDVLDTQRRRRDKITETLTVASFP